MKSTNEGDSWFSPGMSFSGTGRTILFHPTIQGTFFVATSSGIYKTTNDGVSCTQVQAGNFEDLVFQPRNPNVLYACGNAGFYKSIDGGASFTKITVGTSERLKLAVTPADSNYVYLVEKLGSAFGAIYRSTNAGVSFTQRSASNPPYFTQASRDMAIMASSSNADEIHVAGMNNHRSLDGGNSFTTLSTWSAPSDPSYIHADVEVMVCVNDVLYAGSDGGLFRSTNNGDNYTDLSRLGGLAVHQFYRIAGNRNDASMMMGGAQDNGTNIMKNKSTEWIGWLGADGMECFIDYNNSDIIYGTTQKGSLYKSTNGGLSQSGLSSPGSDGNWVTPFEMDPTTSTTIYVGYKSIFKSMNGGTSWTDISGNYTPTSNLDEITIAPSNSDYIYFSVDGNLYLTKNGTNASPSWINVYSGSYNINYITIDPNDPDRAAFVTSASVFETIDGGTTWTNKTLNLPSTGNNCAIYDEEPNNGLYVGTNNSVYYISDDLTDWQPFSDGLPKVKVNELDINYAEKLLRVGTYGRGLWESGMVGTTVVTSVTAKGEFIFCKGGQVTLEATTQNRVGITYTYQWLKDSVNINGATSKEYIATEQGNYQVAVNDGTLNGVSKDFAVTVIELPTTPVNVITSCGPGDVKLQASNNDVEINWYATDVAITPEFTGNEFVPNLTVSKDYYVEAKTIVLNGNVGITDNSVATGGIHGGGFYLVFDAILPLTIKTAKVYADGTADRTLELRDQNDALLESKVINIPDGESVITIDFNIPVAVGYKIGFATGASLFRSNNGTQYPYVIPGLISINGSTASTPTDFYYYLYDIEVQEMTTACTGLRTKVQAKVIDIPAIPTSVETMACVGEPGPYALEVVASLTGEFKWYKTNTDNVALDSGATFLTDSTTSFFVENVVQETIQTNVGPIDNTIGATVSNAGGEFLLFNSSKNILLEKAKVFANGSKIRTIQLKDSLGVLLVDKDIMINDGAQTIDVNINIPIGNGYQLGFKAGADLFINTEGVNYAYQINSGLATKSRTVFLRPMLRF